MHLHHFYIFKTNILFYFCNLVCSIVEVFVKITYIPYNQTKKILQVCAMRIKFELTYKGTIKHLFQT